MNSDFLLSNLLSPRECMMKYFSVKHSLQKSDWAFPVIFLTILYTIMGSFSCFCNSQTYFDSSVSVLPPSRRIGGEGGRDDFCVISFKSQGGDTFRGDDFRQSSRGGGLLYHDELLVFPQNASP